MAKSINSKTLSSLHEACRGLMEIQDGFRKLLGNSEALTMVLSPVRAGYYDRNGKLIKDVYSGLMEVLQSSTIGYDKEGRPVQISSRCGYLVAKIGEVRNLLKDGALKIVGEPAIAKPNKKKKRSVA